MDLLGHFFADLDHLKASAAALVSERKLPLDQVAETVLGSRTPYILHLRKRLSFLHFVLTQSALFLVGPQVERLWDSMQTNALCGEEREFFFTWLRNGCDLNLPKPAGASNATGSYGGYHTSGAVVTEKREPTVSLFSFDIAEYLFRERMTRVQPSDLTRAVYECIERYFLLLNTVEPRKRLELKSDDNGNVDFLVMSFELEGFDVIWRIALEAHSPRVVQRAITFLNNLHEKLSPELIAGVNVVGDAMPPGPPSAPVAEGPRGLARVRSEFIKKCMTRFREYMEANDRVRVERCLFLLNHLLDASEVRGFRGSGPLLRPHGSQLKGSAVQLTVLNNVAKTDKPKKNRTVRSHQYVSVGCARGDRAAPQPRCGLRADHRRWTGDQDGQQRQEAIRGVSQGGGR